MTRMATRKQPLHLVFVDDDPAEVKTFEKHFGPPDYRVTSVCSNSAAEASQLVQNALGKKGPDLFVLDLYFPTRIPAPTSLSNRALEEMKKAADDFTAASRRFDLLSTNGKKFLSETHGAIARLQKGFQTCCEDLSQSPRGGLRLMELLRKKYAKAPIVFLSRKATFFDVKACLEAGAIDILLKPRPDDGDGPFVRLGTEFEQYAQKRAPPWLDRAFANLRRIGVSVGRVTVELNP